MKLISFVWNTSVVVSIVISPSFITPLDFIAQDPQTPKPSISVNHLLTQTIHQQSEPKTKSNLDRRLIFLGDFESGTLAGWKQEACCPEALQVVKSPVRAGQYAMQFILNQTDRNVQGSKRSELVLGTTPAGSERWYGFSIYLPASYQADASSEVVAQWHDYPDFSLGESWRTPPLALKTVAGYWQVSNRWDPNPLTLKNTPGSGGGKENTNLGNYSLDQWTDWVFHVKWSAQGDGLLEVWKNGVQVMRKVGGNTYEDQIGPYFKMGLYKPDWKYRPTKSSTIRRVIYHDEVRIGDEKATYSDVAPR